MSTRVGFPQSRRSGVEPLRSVVCFALMAVCAAQAWLIVFVLQLGPVMGDIDASAGRGVHSGDLLAIPLVCMALVLLAEGGVRSDHRRPHPAPALI